MALINTQPPLLEPVSITELKDMLRLDQSDTSQDDVLNTLEVAARSYVETVTQRRIVQQTWSLYLDFFPGYIDLKLSGQRVSSPFVSGSNAVLVGIRYALALPYSPVQTLQDFTYLNSNGATTSMIQVSDIGAVSNVQGAPLVVTTVEEHGLNNGASITVSGNAPLLALLNGNPSQIITVIDLNNFTINGSIGDGTTVVIGEGAIIGYNFVLDILSQPARLTPNFGYMWPVARVVVNALQIDYTVGYASVLQLEDIIAGQPVIENVTNGGGFTPFPQSAIGQPISIPGAGVNGGTLNTIINKVDIEGYGYLRDVPQTSPANQPISALWVNYGSPGHWELFRSAIKVLVNAWFIQRTPSFDAAQRECISAILGPCMDRRI